MDRSKKTAGEQTAIGDRQGTPDACRGRSKFNDHER